jgi:hypothetical protein
MILVTHALTGAVIGKNIDNAPLIILTSLAAHFLMDHLRHGEYVEVFSESTSLKNSGWKVALDLSIALVSVFSIIWLKNTDPETTSNIALGVLFSILPDFVTGMYWKFRWPFLEKYYSFHSWMHKYPKFSPERQWTLRNATNDIAFSIITIILLFL